MWWLTKNDANSIFESYVFKFAEDLHEKFGISITCNCFYAGIGGDLSKVSDKWQREFEENSKWLKFAFHGWDSTTDYNKVSYEKAREDYERVVEQIKRIAGEASISNIVRTHFFHGNSMAVRAWKDCGVKLLLSADDNRGSYDMKAWEEEIAKKGKYIRKNGGIQFLATDIRLESFEMDINQFLNNYEKNEMVIFTHERLLDDILFRERIVRVLTSLIKKQEIIDMGMEDGV